jgi:hypothetical protein
VHTQIPDQIYHSQVFQEIVLAGADLFSWINDLYSLDKEISCGIVSDLILVPQYERPLSREQAFIAACALISDRVNDLLAAEERLPELIDSLNLDTAPKQRYTATWPASATAPPDLTSGMHTAPAAIRRPLAWVTALVGNVCLSGARAVG